MKHLIIIFGLFIAITGFSQTNIPWKQVWKTKIGLTSYRTNMVIYNGDLLIGSNGKDRNSLSDTLDGVYIINPWTGAVKYHFEGLLLADNDVNGVAIANDVLFYGSDLQYIFAIDLKTYKEKWKHNVSHDIEGVPATADLNNDGVDDVIFNLQGGGTQAFNGMDGSVLWQSIETTHNGNVSPVVFDLNKDGVKDVICGGHSHFALNGRNGKLLWEYRKSSGIHGSPLVVVRGDSVEIHFVASYGDYDILDRRGKAIAGSSITYGLFASPSPSKKAEYVSLASSWHDGGGVYTFSATMKDWNWEDDKNKYGPGDNTKYNSVKAQKVSATSISLDLDGDGTTEFVVADEKGTLYVVHPEKKTNQIYKMPSGAEASLMALKVEGGVRLYYSGLDGYLYCYEVQGAKGIVWGSFRGPNNDGVFVVD